VVHGGYRRGESHHLLLYAADNKIIKTRSAKDVSIAMLLQFVAGVSLWTAYGFHLKDGIIIAGNIITLGSLMVLIVLYFKHRR